jgi:hypothetical protein
MPRVGAGETRHVSLTSGILSPPSTANIWGEGRGGPLTGGGCEGYRWQVEPLTGGHLRAESAERSVEV